MRKKFLAVALVAVMVLALMPTTASAASINSVYVFNYNQNSNLYTYDPANNSNSYAVIQAPYDQIAKSTADGTRSSGPHYKVIFNLNKQLNNGSDYAYLTDQGYRYGVDLTGFNRNSAWQEGYAIYTTFTPQKGGNTRTYTLQVYDAAEQRTTYQNFTVQYIDSYATNYPNYTGNKPNEWMQVNVSANSAYYTASTTGNTVYIDYQSAYVKPGSQVNLTLTFRDANGSLITSEGYIYNVNTTGNTAFIYPYNYDRLGTPARGGVTGGSGTFPVNLDTSISQISIGLETYSTLYNSSTMNVVWRDTANTSSSWLNIQPSRTPTLTVGQEYTFNITSYNWTSTGSSFYLDVGGTSGVVTTATGKNLTIRAQAAGSTYLNVRNSAGTVLDRIYVTVVGSSGSGSGSIGGGSYTVTASSLNVRSGPGAGYSRIGSLKRGSTVSVSSISGGWANINYGSGRGYVSAAYLSYTGGNTGITPLPYDNYYYDPYTGYYTYFPDSGVVGGSTSGNTGIVGGVVGSNPVTGGIVGGGNNVTIPTNGTLFRLNSDTLVRSGPGGWYNSLGTASMNSTVVVYSIGDGWASVLWNGQPGYIMTSVMSRVY